MLERVREGELASEGMVEGAVQVPPDGHPVIFLADHPVTGGYPVIAVVHPADIPLAARCLDKGARVLGPKGHPFTENDIGPALAMRELMDELRQGGAVTGGPAPMTAKDRSRFLSKLDETVNAVRRAHPQR